MSLATVEHAAGVLADLRVRAPGTAPMDDLPEACRPDSLFEAYEIQTRLRELLTRRRPGRQVGWKIGCTTPVMQDYLKIPHPCAGTLYEHGQFSGHADLVLSDYYTLGLECEIAVRLATDLPRRDSLYDRQSVARAVEEVMASIEIVEHRFVDFTKTVTPTLVADDFFSAGCVVGDGVPLAEIADLGLLEGGFSIDGAPPESTGSGHQIVGHPLTALAWLADHAAALGTPLLAGQIVTLGSVVKTIYPGPGMHIEASFAGLPPASVRVR